MSETVSSSVSALVDQTEDGTIVGWAGGAENLFGWTVHEATGMPAARLIPERNRRRHVLALRELFTDSNGRTKTRIITAQHRNGREFGVEVTVTPVLAADGRRAIAVIRAVDAGRPMGAALPVEGHRYSTILDQIEDGCAVVDLRGNYLYVNNAFCRMYGVSRDDIIGGNFTLLELGERATILREIYTEVYRTGQANRGVEYKAAMANGDVRYFEQSVSLERDENGHPIGFLAIIRDCTARTLTEQEVARSREAAESASRAKSEFLANMSHEIRTPMNGIIGMTELALSTELTPYQADCLQTVKVSAESLLTILNDILDFSKIESRRLELESVPFSLRDTIAETLRPLAVRAHDKGLEVIVDIADGVPAGIVGDPVRLRQIITNLVGNAIKFTTAGHVSLSITQEASGPGVTRLAFAVADTGIGIPRDKHATIFEAFSQADGSTTRRFGGTGLGLAISSSLVHLMGGRIWVDSDPGKGSTFRFTAAFDTNESAAMTTKSARLAGISVLVVDDNSVNRRILEGQLVRWGMHPVTVDGGRAAIEALADADRKGRPFRLVLLDAQMPERDGFSVAEAIARRPEFPGATIMLSSGGHYGDSERCRQLGIAAYLTKPVREADLFESMCRVIDGSSQKPVVVASAVKPAATQSRRVLLAEDNIVNQRVAVGLLTKRGHSVRVAATGIEAVAAVAEESFDLVLMDVQMPEMGGLEATALIRERERETGEHIRIVAMTAHAMTGDRERCLAAGMDGYLSKPVEPKMLFDTVEGALEPTRTTIPPDGPLAFDRSGLLERLGGDEAILIDVVQLFLEDAPVRIAALQDAVDARDAERIRFEAHGLRGAAGTLRAEGLQEASRTMERLGSDERLDAAEGAMRALTVEAARVFDCLRRLDIKESGVCVS